VIDVQITTVEYAGAGNVSPTGQAFEGLTGVVDQHRS
jgi:hypothetical protein